MTTDAEFAGLSNEVEERSKSETVAILLVAHFPDVLARLNEFASQQKGVPVQAVLADNLDTNLAASLHLDESAMIDIIVGELHPLPSVDDKLEEFADELPCRCRFSLHVSLKDPVMKIFVGDESRYNEGLRKAEAANLDFETQLDRLTLVEVDGHFSKITFVREFRL